MKDNLKEVKEEINFKLKGLSERVEDLHKKIVRIELKLNSKENK